MLKYVLPLLAVMFAAAAEETGARTVEGKFLNPKFDQDLRQWYLGAEKSVSAVTRQEEESNGFMRVAIAAPGSPRYHGVNTTSLLDVGALCKSIGDAKLVCRARVKLRCMGVSGKGVTLTAEFLKPGENQRFAWAELPFMSGSSDWKVYEVVREVPPETGRIRLAVTFAPGTTGTIDIDDAELVLEVHP